MIMGGGIAITTTASMSTTTRVERSHLKATEHESRLSSVRMIALSEVQVYISHRLITKARRHAVMGLGFLGVAAELSGPQGRDRSMMRPKSA
jgi:hypothetical protein